MNHKRNLIILLFALFNWCGCTSHNTHEGGQPASVDNTWMLIEWFEQHGNYINSGEIPAIMEPAHVYDLRHENILIIDLRPQEQFRAGHIEHALNVRPAEVFDFFRSRVDPTAFEYIVFICNNGHASGYVTSIMRFLGINNAFAMRFGLSGWDRDIAEKYWLANISAHLEADLEFSGNPKHKAGIYPAIATDKSNLTEMLFERARMLLSEPYHAYTLSINDFIDAPQNYYTICYWPQEKYDNNGHLPGAVQYDPKKSLTSDAYLNTLPTDRPIVVYCYSGHHSSFVAAYLRLLGYDAFNLAYGANGFMYGTLQRTESRPTRTFRADLILGSPLVEIAQETPVVPTDKIEKETISIQGGC